MTNTGTGKTGFARRQTTYDHRYYRDRIRKELAGCRKYEKMQALNMIESAARHYWQAAGGDVEEFEEKFNGEGL